MVRLTRAESMALTREKLLKSAFDAFLRGGYEAATIEKISDEAGYSRGAFYAHFDSKEAMYLEIVKAEAGKMAPDLLGLIEGSNSRRQVIKRICEWADKRLIAQDLGYLMLEILQHAKRSGTLDDDQLKPIREYWRMVGDALCRFFPDGRAPGTSEEIGAIVLELAHGPFVEGAGGPKPSRLLRLTLEAFMR